MLKLIDISGFRTSSTTHGFIYKYKDIDIETIVYFKLGFTNDFNPSTMYLFEGDNIHDIAKFHNILKTNGSTIIQNCDTNTFSLIGKKLMYCNNIDASFYTLDIFKTNPIEEESFSHFDLQPTMKKLINIFMDEWGGDYTDPFWINLIY